MEGEGEGEGRSLLNGRVMPAANHVRAEERGKMRERAALLTRTMCDSRGCGETT